MDNLNELRRPHPNLRGLFLTGGEPLLQADQPLIDALCDAFDWVDLETNGTVAPKFSRPDNLWVSCSPKCARIDPSLHPDWYKILVPDKQRLIKIVEEHRAAHQKHAYVYLQPVAVGDADSAQSKENVSTCAKLCYQTGYKMSVQLHKYIGVR